ncbi:MAG: DUF2284 domain-containing protein [Aminipila sp.]
MYRVENLIAEIDVKKYIEDYVSVEQFLQACKECKNYEKKWSCPPYDFDVLDYWKQFNSLLILGEKIIFDKEIISKEYSQEELENIMYKVLSVEKQKLAEKLYGMEKGYKGSISLSAGSCSLCGDGMMNTECCNRSNCKNNGKGAKENCVNFDKMRYSIESLGGNVGKTCTKLLGEELAWCEENKLPTHFILVSGLLKK